LGHQIEQVEEMDGVWFSIQSQIKHVREISQLFSLFQSNASTSKVIFYAALLPLSAADES
jgi:hypothetical protein